MHNRGPRVSLRLLNPTWLVQGLLLWKAPLRRLLKNKKNQNTVKKTKRDVAFITEFLQTKGETRLEIAEILPAELNEPLSEFILSVRYRFEVC